MAKYPHCRAAWVVVGVLGASACGTRLPAESFTTTSAGVTPPSTPGQSSDVGVSASTITLGLVVSATSPLGAEAFSGPMYGARAFIAALNASGGVDGRQVDLKVCDDGATGAGNRRCVTQLIERDHVFAFVANTIYDYAGAATVNASGVPDVGGQPISNAYEQYAHLWSMYGSSSPRDGAVGLHGLLYGGTEVYRYFAEALGTHTAGVVAYNQSDSLRFANLTAKALAAEGYTVVREQLDFAVPSWDAAAIDMRSRGVDIVFDALDSSGNVSLCKAMDTAGLHVKAKVVTVQGWTESVRTDYGKSPTCRNELYATATTRSYTDTANATIARFRTEMRASFPEREDRLSMWTLEGWAAAQWLTDAMSSCGSVLTRRCVEVFLARPDAYDGHGILTPRNFVARTEPDTTAHNCLFVARWSDTTDGGVGGWVPTTPGGDARCFDVPNIAYQP